MRAFLVLALFLPQLALAWGNHSLLAYRALEVLPEVAQARPVPAETLEAFLRAEAPAIAQELDAQEAWALAHEPKHAARPIGLDFPADAALSDAQRRTHFLAALRVSPQSRFALFRQIDPRRERGPLPALLPFEAVSPTTPSKGSTQRFVALQVGELVAPLDVVATASDEPDYGLDLNLFDDNPGVTPPGWGFGRQPFGNPAVSYSSQAPFHMGFFHQGVVFNTLAPGLTRSFTGLRLQQYTGLSRLAFRSGHPYWGWRFMGLALHYVQDLTQPYHASAAPGEGLGHMMWVNLLDQLGRPRGKQALVVLEGNRHIVMEQIQARLIYDAAVADRDGALESALHDRRGDPRYPAWSLDYPRLVVAAEAFEAGPAIDAALVRAVPAHFVSDPSYDFAASSDETELGAGMARQPAGLRGELEQAIAGLMRHLGAHSRNAALGMLAAGKR